MSAEPAPTPKTQPDRLFTRATVVSLELQTIRRPCRSSRRSRRVLRAAAACVESPTAMLESSRAMVIGDETSDGAMPAIPAGGETGSAHVIDTVSAVATARTRGARWKCAAIVSTSSETVVISAGVDSVRANEMLVPSGHVRE
jgi:hypothetical protein